MDMSRDELAFKLLLAIVGNDRTRMSIVNGLMPGIKPADAIAQVAFAQADAFIEAGGTQPAPVPPSKAIDAALDLARRYGGVDGAHHKDWVIDQMVRELTGPLYDTFVAAAKAGNDGPDTYEWREGIAP